MKMGPDDTVFGTGFGRGFNYAQPGKGMSQEAWIANAKATGHPDYPRYVQLAGSEDMGAVKNAMDDVFTGRAVMPPVAGSETSAWKDPAAVARAQNGQAVMKGVGIAHDVLVDSAEKSLNISTKSPKVQQLAFAPVKLAFASVDAKLKYNELTAKGFSHEAAWSGVAAGQAVTQTLAFGGARVGALLGGLATSPTGPGLLAGSAVGGAAGGAIGGLIDWAFEVSDQAALAAANAYDGKNIQ